MVERKEVKCEACDQVIGRAKSDAEALAIFKDHLVGCPFGGVKGRKKSNVPLAVAIVVGIAALGIAVLGLNPAAYKYLESLLREPDTKPGPSEAGASPK